VFTASSPQYAKQILEYIDPESKCISSVLSRKNCMETKRGFFIKDLRVVKDINLERALIVDNLSHSFGLQVGNGIPILEYHSDPSDDQL